MVTRQCCSRRPSHSFLLCRSLTTQVSAALRLLRKRSFISLDSGGCSMHDLTRQFLISRLGPAGLAARHELLLRSYRERCWTVTSQSADWASAPRDGYILDHLEYHASQLETCGRGEAEVGVVLLQPLGRPAEAQPEVPTRGALLAELRAAACATSVRLTRRLLHKYGLTCVLLDTAAEASLWEAMATAEGWEERWDAVELCESRFPHCSGCCLLPAACSLLPAACCLLSAACCLLLAACCVLPAVCCLLLAACCLLPAACCLLPAVCCVLPAVCCLLLAA